MANIVQTGAETVYQIGHWLGLNENPDGDVTLKMGEAVEMRNFRITRDGHLQKRPGCKTVVDLDGPVMGLWTGNVNGTEHTLAAAGGKVYRIDTADGTKTELGYVADEKVFFFGYGGKVYLLDGESYKVWDGVRLQDVAGYRPLVSVAVSPAGGGTGLEQVNKLNGLRRCRFSPDGTSTVYRLPENGLTSVDWIKDLATGQTVEPTAYTVDAAAGTVTFQAAPEVGVNSLEIAWTYPVSGRTQVTAMRFAESYNGTTDNRVFLYGDGTNRTLYSGLDQNGRPTAEYFPDLNEMAVGEENSPITGMIRQFSRLILFKRDSTWSVAYSSLTLEDGTVTAGFYVTPVNRVIGNEAPGQVRLITNHPRTLHGGGVYEWKNGSNGLTQDERQAKRISGRVENSLAAFDLQNCVTFENEYSQEYYIVSGDRALVHNYTADAWYLYTDFPVRAFTMVENRVYTGMADGRVCALSREYMSDDGAAIDAWWCSGSMSFDREWRRKFSTMLYVAMKPEAAGRVTIMAMSDRKADYAEKVVACSLATFGKVNFNHFSFSTNRRSRVVRVRLKVKKFALYQLVLRSNSASERCTIETVDFRLRYTGYVK